jgi:hypothetical protein
VVLYLILSYDAIAPYVGNVYCGGSPAEKGHIFFSGHYFDDNMHQVPKKSSMDIEKLIEALKAKSILQPIQTKRITTTELPAHLYIRLIIASMATKKSSTACLSTAIETYCMRNEEKHLNEIRLQAAAAGKEIEEYLAEEIAQRLQSKSSQD